MRLSGLKNFVLFGKNNSTIGGAVETNLPHSEKNCLFTPYGIALSTPQQPGSLVMFRALSHPRWLSAPNSYHACICYLDSTGKVITMCAIIYIPTMIHNSGFNGADTPIILTGTAHNASRYIH